MWNLYDIKSTIWVMTGESAEIQRAGERCVFRGLEPLYVKG